MRKARLRNALLIVLTMGSFFVVQAQQDRNILLLFDRIVGLENTELFTGVEYVEKHRIVNEKHKFFKSFNYLPGMVIYDGQKYYQVDLKYNVFEDLLLVELEGSKGKNRFRLFREKLDGFEMDGQRFVNLQGPSSDKMIYEVLFEEKDLMLLKKHRKNMKKILSGDLLHHEFENLEPHFFFGTSGTVHELNQGNLTETFPDLKQEIRDFYRFNRRLRKSDPEEFANRIFKGVLTSKTGKQ